MKTKIKVLNLYGGVGGNRKLWKNVDVTTVEYSPKIADAYKFLFPNDKVVVSDAHQYLADNYKLFDFVWSSPPCQKHTKMVKFTRHDVKCFPDFKLYEEIVFLDNFFKGKWVVENVKPYYTPLIEPTKVLGRHLFWSNFRINDFTLKSPHNFINLNTVGGANDLKKWLGLEYPGNIYYEGNHSPTQVLRNCVHPLLGQHIFNSAYEG